MPRRRGNGEERISEKDLAVLEFVARFGQVPRSAVAVWAGTGRSVTLDRERRLRDAGLIEPHPAYLIPGPLLTATRRGLRLCGREELRPKRYTLWTLRHDIVVAHVAARLELAGELIVSEREFIASERLTGKRSYSVRRYREEGYHRPEVHPLTLPDLRWPRPTRLPSGGLGEAVKRLRRDPLEGLTGSPPPLPSRVGRRE